MADRRSRRKKRLLVLLAGATLLAATAVAGKVALDWRRTQRAAQALERGMASYEAGEYAAALPNLGRAVSRFMDRPDVLYAIADTRRRIPEPNGRHVTSAIGFARAARDAAPTDPRPRLLLIELYSIAGFVSEILDESGVVLAAEPGNPEALRARIGALIALGRREEAVQAAEALRSATPGHIDSLQMLAATLTNAGRPIQDVRDRVDALAAEFPDSPSYLGLQAALAISAGDRALAVSRLRDAAGMEPGNAQDLATVVTLCDALFGDDSELFDVAANAITSSLRDPELAADAAPFVLFRDWRLLQRSTTSRARSLDPTDVRLSTEAIGWAAFLLQNAGEPGNDGFAIALKARPSSPIRDAWLAAIDLEVALRNSDLAAARAALDRARAAQAASGAAESICPPAEFARARLSLALGDLVTAESQLIELGLQRDWLIARVELLQLLLAQNRVREAATLIGADPFLARAPAVPQAFASSLATLLASDRATPALASEMLGFLDSFVQADPENADLVAYRAIALHAAGRQDEARAAFATLSPANLSDRARILVAYTSRSNSQDPAEIDTLLTDPPKSPGPLLSAALVIDAAGHREAALSLFDTAIAAADPSARLDFELARASFLDRIGDSAARASLLRLAESSPDSMPAQLALLESSAAWTDPDGLGTAIARYGAIAGSGSPSTLVYEARRLILFDESQAGLALAISKLHDAKALSWPNPRISELLADAELRNERPDRAIQHLGEAVQASPAGVALYPRLVLLLRERGDTVEAGRYLDAFLAQDLLTPELLLARANLAFVAGRHQQALADFRQLAARGDQAAEIGVANTLVALGSSREAEEIYQRLTGGDRPSPDATLAYADYLGLTGRIEQGSQLLGRLPETVGEAPRARIVAEFYARHAPAELAETVMIQLADSGDAPTAGRLAAFLLNRGRPAEAAAAADRYLHQFPGDSRLREVRALARLQGGGTAEASAEELADLAALAEARDPDSPYARLTKAMLENSRGTLEANQFLERLRTLLQRDPTFLPAAAVLVQTLQAAGRPAEAAEVASNAANAVPSNANAAEMAARSLAAAGRLAPAEGMISRWKALLTRPSPTPDVLAAEIALAQGRAQAARTALSPWLDELIAHPPRDQDARPLLAATLALNGDHGRAQGLFPPGILTDDDAGSYLNAATLMAPSNPESARAWIIAGLDRFPEPEARRSIAAFLISLGTDRNNSQAFVSALEVLSALEKSGQTSASTSGLRAAAHAGLAQRDEAITAYRDAINQNPDDLLALNNLANLLSADESTASEAAVLAQRALSLAEGLGLPAPLLANILDTLGVALLASGDAAKSGEAFRRGLSLDPSSTGCQVGVVEALVGQGQLTQARAALRNVRAAEAQANPEVRPRLERVSAQLRQ